MCVSLFLCFFFKLKYSFLLLLLLLLHVHKETFETAYTFAFLTILSFVASWMLLIIIVFGACKYNGNDI